MAKLDKDSKFYLSSQDCDAGFDVMDFWSFTYSSPWSQRDKIAEFIVSKALQIHAPINNEAWTLYDILYNDIKIEVKETGYYQPWKNTISKQRTFGIEGAYSVYKDKTSTFCRQSDLYVFCLNTGEDPESAFPLDLSHWVFYVMSTTQIDRLCGNAKTLSLGRLKKFVDKGLAMECLYSQLKDTIDAVINSANGMKNSKCLMCNHLRAHLMELGEFSCDAFPEGIPEKYVNGELVHTKIEQGQAEDVCFPEEVMPVLVSMPYVSVKRKSQPKPDACELCLKCKHYKMDEFGNETCSAFPDGIPHMVIECIGHEKPLIGQNENKIVFEPKSSPISTGEIE